MEIVICSTPEEAGEVAAARVAQVVKEAGPTAVLGVATGSSPLALYEGLTRRVEDGSLDLSQASAFALDEYVGLPAGDPNSYAATIDETVTVPLKMNPANVHVPDGDAADLKQACEDYEAAIKAAGGVDVQILGIGSNGHIGFNEPSSSGQSDTWMWGWNNINGFPEGVVEIADEVYNFGEHFDEPLLTVAQQPLGEAERTAEGLPDADYGFGVERTFVHVAQALSGIAAPLYYRAPTGNGSFVWFLLSNPAEFALPPATVLKTLSALTESLQSGYVHDAVAALTGYADKREGVTLELGEGAAVLHTTDGDVNVELDEQGRIARIFGTAGGGTTHVVTPQDAPAPQAPPAARAAGVRSAGEEGLLRQAVRSLTEPVVQIASAGRRPRRLNATKHPRAAATQMTPDMPSATGPP